jgi:4-hydroxybenzoate polyprenyltransferase and related prenyltransferases
MPSPISRVWQELSWIVRVSRPRFWLYLFGPYLLGIVAAFKYTTERYSFVPTSDHWLIDRTFLIDLLTSVEWLFLRESVTAALILLASLLIAFGYFLFSANLLVYGVNDIFDIETDALNAKKDGYEVRVKPSQRLRLLLWIIFAQLPWIFVGLVVFAGSSWQQIHRPFSAFFAFLFLGIFYSSPPIRAKARPFLDSLFNILYVMPGLFSFFLARRQSRDGFPRPLPLGYRFSPPLSGAWPCMPTAPCQISPPTSKRISQRSPQNSERVAPSLPA